MSTAWYHEQEAPTGVRQFAASKVPTITGLFWAIKILTTGMGEATSDYLVHTYNPYLAVVAGAIVFAVAMTAQLLTKRYMTWVYWFAVVMVSVFGTMCADVAHIVLGVPYAISASTFAVVLAVILTLWYKSEGTLSIHSIRTPRRELFYWATVLATFALGTATGDLTARTLHLGFLASGIMFVVVFAIPAIGNWKLGWNPIFAFWFAYIVTRPLGASFADYLGLSHTYGGIGLGDGPVAAVATVLIVILVAVLAVTGKDVEERGARSEAGQHAGGGRHRAPGPAPAGPAGPAWSGAAGPASYGQGDQTRRLVTPSGPAGPGRPGQARGQQPPPPPEGRRYGHGDPTRPLDRRGPQRSAGRPDSYYGNGAPASNGYPAPSRGQERPGPRNAGPEHQNGAIRPGQWAPFRPDEEPPAGPWRPEDDQAGW